MFVRRGSVTLKGTLQMVLPKGGGEDSMFGNPTQFLVENTQLIKNRIDWKGIN